MVWEGRDFYKLGKAGRAKDAPRISEPPLDMQTQGCPVGGGRPPTDHLGTLHVTAQVLQGKPSPVDKGKPTFTEGSQSLTDAPTGQRIIDLNESSKLGM